MLQRNPIIIPTARQQKFGISVPLRAPFEQDSALKRRCSHPSSKRAYSPLTHARLPNKMQGFAQHLPFKSHLRSLTHVCPTKCKVSRNIFHSSLISAHSRTSAQQNARFRATSSIQVSSPLTHACPTKCKVSRNIFHSSLILKAAVPLRSTNAERQSTIESQAVPFLYFRDQPTDLRLQDQPTRLKTS